MGLRDKIREIQDIQIVEVPVPEWGETLRVRGLTGAERDQFEGALMKVSSNGGRTASMQISTGNVRALLVSLSVIDENGQRIFSDADVDWLGKKSATALDRIASKAMELSGLSGETLEIAEKN